MMKIQINTDKNISGNAAHEEWLNKTIQTSLTRFKDRITRIEIHLSDENGDKGGKGDKKCMLEARPEGLQPVAVISESETIDQAVIDALAKMENLLTSLLNQKNEYSHKVYKNEQ